jgi:hypothetical protein
MSGNLIVQDRDLLLDDGEIPLGPLHITMSLSRLVNPIMIMIMITSKYITRKDNESYTYDEYSDQVLNHEDTKVSPPVVISIVKKRG